MHSARAVVFIAALASSCIPYSGQASTAIAAASDEESARNYHQKQHPGFLALLRAASLIAKENSPPPPSPHSRFFYNSAPTDSRRQSSPPYSSNLGHFLRYIAPSNELYGGASEGETSSSLQRQEDPTSQHVVGARPPEEGVEKSLAVQDAMDSFGSDELGGRPIIWAKKSDPSGVSAAKLSGEEEQIMQGLQQASASIASNFLRSARSGPQPYDVPIIECPAAEDQMDRFPCPSPDRKGRYRCIDDHVLCDGFIDCPDGEDEDRQQCMFYKTTKAHLDIMADAIIRFIRSPK